MRHQLGDEVERFLVRHADDPLDPHRVQIKRLAAVFGMRADQRMDPRHQVVSSPVGRLSQCSLHGRIKRAEKSGPVLLGQRSWPAGIRPELPKVPGYLTTGERIAYIRLRPLFAGRGDDARPFFEAPCCQRNVGGDAYVDGRDVLRDPVIGRICAVTDQDHSHVRGAWRPDRSRAVGDNKNIKP